ncbi:TRAP transporter large permease subunit [Maritimibacter sp. UBA3975]|uniref:TRAP transporter large permease n=1 Tax=Maritimibacter sp. UBA3975 TaxID=1946833 RepID=UPI0025B8BF8E|nr:TRAP transporter large permease subunit [Maritimibacter sp. UBA3975]
MAGLGIVVLLFGLIALRQNIVVILLAIAAYVHLVWADGDLTYLVEDMWLALDNDVLLAVPMFLIAGNLMTRGSIARRLIEVARLITAPIPGGLGVATILSCAIFAAISGSSPVTLLAVGSVLYPALIENGYSKKFALGALTSGGTLGIIIPPSIPLILYGVVTEHSIASLFLAGIIPGLMLTAAMSGYALIVNRHIPTAPFDPRALWEALRRGIWAILMPIILLGGIYSGMFSPTEAAAVALFYGLIVEAFIHRELGVKDVYRTMVDTARTLGMLFPIIAVALSLKNVLTIEGIPQMMADWIAITTGSKVAFLLATNVMLLVVGCFFDVVSSILILGPLLLAAAQTFGIDPIHFGVIMAINLEIGFLTPPIGLNLIVAMSVFRARFSEICFAVIPFVAIIGVVLLLVTFIPQLSLWLVN